MPWAFRIFLAFMNTATEYNDGTSCDLQTILKPMRFRGYSTRTYIASKLSSRDLQ